LFLNELKTGNKALVKKIKASGEKRRRLLDLGLIPETEVVSKRKSPSGDPGAFLIRGTIIALRSEDTSLIEIKPLNKYTEGR